MIFNYFKTAIRSFVNQKIYSFINISGLAIGLASCIMIILFIINEFSYDRFHKDHERIYRICVDGRMSGDFFHVAVTPFPFGPESVKDFPEIDQAVRLNNVPGNPFLSYHENKFYEDRIMYTDSNFFKVFSFELLSGNPDNVLKEPNSIVLTKSRAEKYFGDEDPIGRILRMNDHDNMKVTGIMEDVPKNSHLNFSMLISWTTSPNLNNPQINNWGSLSIYTYIKLKENADNVKLDEKMDLYIMEKFSADAGVTVEDVQNYNIEFIPFLQKIKDIHLYSDLMAEAGPNGDISDIYLFGAIAIFIILIACINFMNLSTARSSKRAREVGIRKVHGAYRRQLIRQFIGESVLYSIISLLVALALVEIFMPVFNKILGRELEIGAFSHQYLIISYVFFAVIIGIIAGSYPAFYLSSFKPVKVLKGSSTDRSRKSVLRNILVLFQFSISIFLLIGTGIIYGQLKYFKNKKLGFDKEHVITIPLRNERLINKYEVLKEELKTVPGVVNVAASSSISGEDLDGSAFFPEGFPEQNPWLIYYSSVDYEYINTMGMQLLQGRNFSPDFTTDTASVIINYTLLKKLGWEDPIGKKFMLGDPNEGFELKVIGVVNDFHYLSLRQKIEPIMLMYNPGEFTGLNLKLGKQDIRKAIENIENKWTELEKAFPLDYRFMNQTFDNLYQNEEKTASLFISFSVIAIFIACLGLFGLASYTAEQRRKEIGIRKSLGSTANAIILMLSKEYTRWVLVANIIAWPVAFFLLDNWLSNFAYRIQILNYWWVFFIAAVIALLIAICTVLFQSVRAANDNPVNALKYE